MIKSAYSVSFLLSKNSFVWQNVLYFPNDLLICVYVCVCVCVCVCICALFLFSVYFFLFSLL